MIGLTLGGLAQAQSLVEAAEREKERRRKLGASGSPTSKPQAPATRTPQAKAPEPPAPNPKQEIHFSIVYTGRSLGALGVLREQAEHELLTEQANSDGEPFRLVSHPCWRAPGLSMFAPSDELELDSLAALLESKDTAQPLGSFRALSSNNVTLVLDPEHAGADLLALLRKNPRAATDFPDLRETRVSIARTKGPHDEPVLIVREGEAAWPDDPAAWTLGEMNRVDVKGARLFELPANLGPIGSRATVLRKLAREAAASASQTLIVDLGERDGDLGVTRAERARIDYTALTRLGYGLVVPFEFELALGKQELTKVAGEFAGLRWLASNVKAKDAPWLEARRILEVDGVKIGLIGLVDPDIRGQLPHATLADWSFESPVDAADRETKALRRAGVSAVIALSNLHPRDNAVVARDVKGIDAIVADLHVRWSPEALKTDVELLDRPRSQPGSPALVARGFANGLGVGRLDLTFRRTAAGAYLSSLSHRLDSVTDRTPADAKLVAEVQSMRRRAEPERGELMFPAFGDLVKRRPSLREFDATTAQGRVSKRMWEQFLARLLRRRASAEVALVRKLPHFPPLIGKLHEPEVRSWLWTEDSIVLLDIQGVDLRKILLEDVRGELVTSGIDRGKWLVHGRRLDDLTYYRVATTDVLFEGARFRDFEKGRRIRRQFETRPDGRIEGAGSGSPLLLRDFVLGELKRVRSLGKGDAYFDRIAELLRPDPPYEKLLMLVFDHPTLFGSVNQVWNNDGYGAVPESRVTSNNSGMFGGSGRFKLTQDRQVFATDLSIAAAYSRQRASVGSGAKQVTESADDLKLELTLRPKTLGKAAWLVHPFVRTSFDSEFTPTFNPEQRRNNPRQLALRGVAGAMFAPTPRWRALELGAAVENDFGLGTLQYGLQAKVEFVQRFGPLGKLAYRLRNDATYFLPRGGDSASDLSLRYNMLHEVLIPFMDELSLSIAADLFFFKGKVPATNTLGTSALLRVGLTYDRLWKPRYQPLF